jgi:hypothetical protein
MTESTATAQPGFNLWSREFIDDPHAFYRRMHAEAPAYWDGGGWVFARFADVQAALRDARFGSERIHPDPEWLEQSGMGPLFNAHQHMMLFTDPPDHTRLRGLVNKAFTPRAVERMRDTIQQLVDEMIDAAPAGRLDLIHDLAHPLPVTVIASMLGVPQEQREQFKRWSEPIAAFIGGSTAPEEQMLRAALQSVVEMGDYFREMASQRRRNPQDDLLTAMALAEEQGDRLSTDELVANCILLLVAGHETTTNLIGNGMLALLQNPEQLALLRERPDLIGNAVEELLRYDSPVQGTSRLAKADVTLGDCEIKAGQHVQLMIGGANRDPLQYADPDRLDITRADVRHLSFAHGAHFCVGAPLARLEGQIAIGTLLRRLPNLALTGEPLEWRDNFTLRGLKALPLAF